MKRFLPLMFVVFVLSACNSRNPAAIHAEREGRPTPTMLPARQVMRQPRQVRHQAAAPAAPRPTLRPGKVIRNSTETIEGDLKPLDLDQMIRAGNIKIAGAIPDYERLFDKNVTSLYRTDGVNPFVLEMEFREPVNLKTIRIYPSYSSYDWAVYLDGAEKGTIVRSVPEEQWSRMDLDEAVETNKVRIEVLRLERDDYVHLNEVEMYTE